MNIFRIISLTVLMLLLSPHFAFGQGTTFIYDQQSATESGPIGWPLWIDAAIPSGQSFIPTFSKVGFVRLDLVNASNILGATISVNLRANSITGTVLGSTAPVFMPYKFGGFTDFFFATPVAVTPGTTYYFQPVVQPGDTWGVTHYFNSYSGGTTYYQGAPLPGMDLWFREGLAVPEPSSIILGMVGIGVLVCTRRIKIASET